MLVLFYFLCVVVFECFVSIRSCFWVLIQLYCLNWGFPWLQFTSCKNKQNIKHDKIPLDLTLVGSFILFLSLSHFVTELITSKSHSSEHRSGPLTATCSKPFNISFLSLFLRSVFIILTSEAPLSGQALDTGRVKISSTTLVKFGHM